jgi:hypothetical protein
MTEFNEEELLNEDQDEKNDTAISSSNGTGAGALGGIIDNDFLTLFR